MKAISYTSILFILLAEVSFAQEKTLIKEYTYRASDLDSKVTARENAMSQIKLLAAQEVITYIYSKNESNTFETKSDFQSNYQSEILEFTATIMKLRVLDEKWNGIEYYLKAEIKIDETKAQDEVMRLINHNSNRTVQEVPIVSSEQEKTFKICGKVTDKQGSALMGVNVVLKTTSFGTVTDIDGNFCFTIPSSLKNGTIVISWLNKSYEVEIDNRSIVDVQLNLKQ